MIEPRPLLSVPGLAIAAALALNAGALARQNAAPKVAAAPAAAPSPNAAQDTPKPRRTLTGPPTALAFKGVTVEQMVPFIVESTGKVVMPQQDVLSKKVTVLNDEPVPRERAYDLVVLALEQVGVAVVETETTITLRDIAEIDRQDVPVVPANQSVLDRTDLGTIVEKVYALQHSSAESFATVLKDAVPKFAKLTVDKESNQLAIMGNIALLQRMERLIGSLDKPSSDALTTETFKLRYADCARVMENIRDLYSAEAGRGPSRHRSKPTDQDQQRRFYYPGQQQPTEPSENLRVTANTQQNSVTVIAEPLVIEEIRRQIDEHWDLPLPKDAVIPRIYELKNSDPVKIRDLLEKLFGQGTPAAQAAPVTPGNQGGGQFQNQGGPAQSRPATGSTQGIGRLAGQFSFQAIPESGRLVVVAKTPENLAIIDDIIRGLDEPQTVGLPEIVELKHANAEELGEQLNSLLALDGTLAQIKRSETGLTASNSANASPFSTSNQNQLQGVNPTGQNQQEQVPADSIAFWWQRSRPPTDTRGSSNLVGQIRLVPVWRQNALMVLAPPEYRHAIAELIGSLDKPGRQVLISAIVAEVQRDDATALGLRWSSSAINPTNGDNSISIGTTTTGEKDDLIGRLFDTSVLKVNANLNLVLQALAQKTAVSILSEPRIFTSDNQEAQFFNGQDIPFVTNTQTTTTGNLIQSFDYKAVGIRLSARPRITINGDVDLKVNLELSSIVPGQTLFGGFIVNRRETTTQLIVQNGQTVVISGIMRSEDSNVIRKIPLLGDIPILGAIFRSKEVEKHNIELLVFLTPVVQATTDKAGLVNEPYLKRLEEIRQQHDLMDKGKLPPNDPPASPDKKG